MALSRFIVYYMQKACQNADGFEFESQVLCIVCARYAILTYSFQGCQLLTEFLSYSCLFRLPSFAPTNDLQRQLRGGIEV